ncbi:MAG: hypothetical protein ACR2FN_11990 [Chitinophagaceae bacterium]
MKKQYPLCLFICILFTAKTIAQVKIGDNPSKINSNSLLELETTNKGFVFPRVTLSDVASPSPLSAGVLQGTVVYSTTSPSGGSGVGLYVWTGAAWSAITPTSVSPTGNAGGDLSGTYPNPTVTRIRGINISATTPTNGQYFSYNGTAWAPITPPYINSITLNTPVLIYANPINFAVNSGAATGTLALNNQSPNFVFAGPASGVANTPTFRGLVLSDMPQGGAGEVLTGNGAGNAPSYASAALRGNYTIVYGTGHITATNSYQVLPGLSATLSLTAGDKVIIHAKIGVGVNQNDAPGDYGNVVFSLTQNGNVLSNGGYSVASVNDLNPSAAYNTAPIFATYDIPTSDNYTFTISAAEFYKASGTIYVSGNGSFSGNSYDGILQGVMEIQILKL